MALIVGKDTYITLQEMDTYVSTHWVSTDPLRVQWEALIDADKEVYLRRSFEQLNKLPYTGRPLNASQKLPFPRHPKFTEDDWNKVKNAQAEQSMAITDSVALQELAERIDLRRAGVVQYRIGDLSEKFQDGLPVDSNANYFGLSERAYDYLSKWLRGGYKICTSIKSHYGIQWRLLL